MAKISFIVFMIGIYEVQYYDGMIRPLKKEMLKKWDPNSAPMAPRRRRLKREEK